MNPRFSWAAVLAGLALAWPAWAQQEFGNHSALYTWVGQEAQFRPVFERREIAQVNPTARRAEVKDLGAGWGSVWIEREGVVIGGKRQRWAQAKRTWGVARPVHVDLELAQVWEQSGPRHRLCIQSPSGSSASAARWQHVVVVEWPARRSKPAMYTWVAPYASCEAVWVNGAGVLIAGGFEMQFESEQRMTDASLALWQMASGVVFARYALELKEGANPFELRALRQLPH